MSSRSVLASLLVASALALAGCADHACIQWSEAEGACPSRYEAQTAMQSTGCSDVLSVDGDGDFEQSDGLCCYPVTRNNNSYCASY